MPSKRYNHNKHNSKMVNKMLQMKKMPIMSHILCPKEKRKILRLIWSILHRKICFPWRFCFSLFQNYLTMIGTSACRRIAKPANSLPKPLNSLAFLVLPSFNDFKLLKLVVGEQSLNLLFVSLLLALLLVDWLALVAAKYCSRSS